MAAQVTRVKDRFGITKVVLVGDRGMLTAARLREDVAPAHLDWITALRAPQVKKLVRGGDLQLTLFDVQDLAEITSPEFPGERLVACKNPFLEAERARKRESLLAATEADLEKIAAACTRTRRPLRGQDTIAVRADRVLARRKVAKHFTIDIGEDHLSYARNQDSIAAEAALDGIYVLRTSVEAATWTAARSSPPTRPWPRSSGPSAPSILTWTSAPSGTAPRTGSGRTCSCGCCRTTSAGTCRPGSRPCCSPTTTSPPPPPPGPARSPPPPAPPRPGQGRHQADPRRPPGAQLRHPARRPRHDLPEHHRAGRPRLPASGSSPPRPLSSGRLRAARRQPPPRGRVVSTPARAPESPGKRPTRGSLGEYG